MLARTIVDPPPPAAAGGSVVLCGVGAGVTEARLPPRHDERVWAEEAEEGEVVVVVVVRGVEEPVAVAVAVAVVVVPLALVPVVVEWGVLYAAPARTGTTQRGWEGGEVVAVPPLEAGDAVESS